MSLPTNFYLVHNGTFRTSAEVFEELGDAVAFADEMADFGGTWHVAACLMPNALAYTTNKTKAKRKKALAKRRVREAKTR